MIARRTILLALAVVVLVPACAGPRASRSELEWQRGQCAQVIDAEARKRCLERVESQ